MTNSTETGMATRFDGNSELVAELATVNGFKAAYAIKDGAEGPRGWMVCNFFFLPFSFYWRIHLLYDINRVFKNTLHVVSSCRVVGFLG